MKQVQITRIIILLKHPIHLVGILSKWALQLTTQRKLGPPQGTLTLAEKCVLNFKGVFLIWLMSYQLPVTRE